MSRSERLLVRLPGPKLGDFLMTTPMLAGLRTSIPSARITLLLWPNSSESWLPHHAASGCDLYDDVIWDDASGAYAGPAGFIRYVRLLKGRRFNAAISLHGGSRTGLAWSLARIPVRVGNVRRETSLLFNANHIQQRRIPDQHEVEYNYDLARPLGVTGEPGRMTWPVSDVDRMEAFRLLSAGGLTNEAQYIVINPMHGGSSRSWPGEMFGQTARRLEQETGARIVVIGGPEHSAANEAIATTMGGAINLTGATTLSVLAAICETALMHISVDTGTMHLAAAMGTPCVGIFPIAEFWDQRVRWQPWMTEHRVVGPTARCSDCLPQKCRRTQTVCIDSISVDAVVSASKDILSL